MLDIFPIGFKKIILVNKKNYKLAKQKIRFDKCIVIEQMHV